MQISRESYSRALNSISVGFVATFLLGTIEFFAFSSDHTFPSPWLAMLALLPYPFLGLVVRKKRFVMGELVAVGAFFLIFILFIIMFSILLAGALAE